MIPLITKQAVAKKCTFEYAKLTGNYECAYACGILSAKLGISLKEDMSDLVSLWKEILDKGSEYPFDKDGENYSKLFFLLSNYEPSEIYDEQMKELYVDGYNEKKF